MRDERATGLNSVSRSGGREYGTPGTTQTREASALWMSLCATSGAVRNRMLHDFFPGFVWASGHTQNDQLSKKKFLIPKEIAAINVYILTQQLETELKIKTSESLLSL